MIEDIDTYGDYPSCTSERTVLSGGSGTNWPAVGPPLMVFGWEPFAPRTSMRHAVFERTRTPSDVKVADIFGLTVTLIVTSDP